MRLDAHEDNVRRLYPQLLELLEGEEPADAGCALCTALTIIAWREGYALSALLWLTEGSIRNGWAQLKQYGMPEEADQKLPNGEEKDEQQTKAKASAKIRRRRPRP